MEPIRSTRNRAVVEAGRLHRAVDRRRLGRSLIEGPHLLDEALAAGVTIHRTFCLEDDPGINRWPAVSPVDEIVLAKLAGTDSPRGPVAVVDIPSSVPLPLDRSVLALWDVSDPGNVGTILRSAAAFGLGVAVGPGTADLWAPKVLRAGAGAHFRIPLSVFGSLDDFDRHRLAATVVAGGVDPVDIGAGHWVVLIGSEAHGLSPDSIAAAAIRISIPMPGGTESLNAAIAASIVAYGLSRGAGRRSPHR
ncbi:MAG: TrmH family RNA methyltransferase [Acidimicrobiia bacterium]